LDEEKLLKGEAKRSEASQPATRRSLRGAKPLFRNPLPLPLNKGKGDTGGWGYQTKPCRG